ncbi:MAG: phosphoribosylanthranilate isomerase, partial [Butyricicoccaceae bacterium]
IPAVGVFVNEPLEHVVSLCERGIIDLIQLHGDETDTYVQRLRARVHNPIIRALRVRCAEQILEADAKGFDYLLLDAYNKNAYGGTGESFQWSIIPPLNTPYFLAGGLDENNLAAAAAATNAMCLDLSSSAETNGAKDPEKMRRLISIVRSI